MASERAAAGGAPSWLLRNRLLPADHDGAVDRSSLIAAVHGHRTLVVAPPGFGKTCLMGQWFRQAADATATVGWLTCDALDDAPTMLAYVAAAFGMETEPLLDLADRAFGRALQQVLSTVEARATPHVLFLDNVGDCPPAMVDALLLPLLRLAPANLSIVCALRSRDETLERLADHVVGADDLRFDLDSVKQLCGRSVSAQRAQAVHREAQGWPTLVAILVEQYRRTTRRPALEGPVASFAHRHLYPLLDPDDLRAFRTLSVIGSFDTVLAHAFASEASIARLRALALVAPVTAGDTRNLMVNPLLANLARTEHGQDAVAIKRQAARHLFERGEYVAATRLAVEIADDEVVVDIVDACNPLRMFLGPGIAHLERITRLIPQEMVDRNPRIACAIVISLLKSGELRKARARFDALSARLEGRDLEPTLEIALITAKSLLNIHQGHPHSEEDIATMRALSGQPFADASIARSWIATVRTHQAQSMGWIAEARSAAIEGIRSSGDFGGRYALFYHHCDLAGIELAAGRSDLARATFRQAMASYRDVLRADVRLSVIVDTFLIEMDHEDDPGDRRHMARLRTICRNLPRLEGWPEVFAGAFRTYSEKLMLSGDARGAFLALDAGLRYAVDEDIQPLTFIFDHQRALLHMMAGDIAAAKHAIAPYRSIDEAELRSRTWREAEVCMEARAAIHAVEPDRTYPLLLAAAMSTAAFHDLGRCKRRYRALVDPARRGFRSAAFHLAEETDTPPAREADRPDGLLTPRSLEILQALRAGMSDKQIALTLGISPHGVRYHLKRAYSQMKVNSRAEACRAAADLLEPAAVL